MCEISIIVPVYNKEEYLRCCIDSILTQTFTDFELLLIDDGSTDKSGLICDEYALKDSRVRVFHKENGGVISARKVGCMNAASNYIYFSDADDYINKDAIATIINEIDDEIDIILFGQTLNGIFSSEEYVTGLLTRTIRWSNCGNLYKKYLFDESTFETSRYFNVGEDFLTALRIAGNLRRKVLVKNIHNYNYRMVSNSAMATYNRTLEYEEAMIGEVNRIVKAYNNTQKPLFEYNIMMLGGLIGLGLLTTFEKNWIIDIINESRFVDLTYRQSIIIKSTSSIYWRKMLTIERSLKEFIRRLLGRR